MLFIFELRRYKVINDLLTFLCEFEVKYRNPAFGKLIYSMILAYNYRIFKHIIINLYLYS